MWRRALSWLSLPRRVPFVPQTAKSDCGAACLAMVLAYHGRSAQVARLRALLGSGRDGTTALAIQQVARDFGLECEGVSVSRSEEALLLPGAILHWSGQHFVVLERAGGGRYQIVDPAFGRRRLTAAEFWREFTGTALLSAAGAAFRPQRDRSWPLWRYLRLVLAHRGLWLRVILLSVGLQLLSLLFPLVTSSVTDRALPRGDYHLVQIIALGAASLLGFQLLMNLVRALLFRHLRMWIDTRMTADFLGHLASLPQAFFDDRSSGDLLVRLNSIAAVRETLTAKFLSTVLDGTMVLFYLAVMLVASPSLAGVVLGIAVAQGAAYFVSARRRRTLASRTHRATADMRTYEMDVLGGMDTLKANGLEGGAIAQWLRRFTSVQEIALSEAHVVALTDTVSTTLRLGAPVAIFLWGTTLVLGGEMTLGTMLGLNALATGLLGPLSSLMSVGFELHVLKTHIERLNDVFDTPREDRPDGEEHAPARPGAFVVADLDFRHGPFSPDVIRGLSLEIRPGQLVAVVGRSGSGKSTLARLLVGLYRPTRGVVLVDGIDTGTSNLGAARKRLGVVLQQPFVFAGTIAENITMEDNAASREAVEAAARAAQLHEEILAMPLGYETRLQSGGAGLSGGQRQRLAIARALYRNPSVLVFDEATSALDAETEARVLRQIEDLRCTRVVIAHRLSTVARADQILVLEQGELVERGTHQALVARGGLYARLVAAQIAPGDEPAARDVTSLSEAGKNGKSYEENDGGRQPAGARVGALAASSGRAPGAH